MKVFPIRFFPPLSLKPYARNTKMHASAQVKKIASVLQRFDFDQPIVVDPDMVIIKGHGRYLAAISLKMTMVPVIIRDDLTDEEVVAARISDNRVAELGDIDETRVKSEMMDFQQNGGEGGAELFDFMKPVVGAPGASPHDDSSDESGIELDTQISDSKHLDGTMVVCPKCHHTQWEDFNA